MLHPFIRFLRHGDMGHVRTDSSEFETVEEFKYGVSIAWIQ